MTRSESGGGDVMESMDADRSDRILAAVKRRKAEAAVVQAEEAMVDLVIFTLNRDFYAFDSGDVKELLPYGTITFVPGCPDIIEGVINVRGDIESVLNLHRILAMTFPEPTKDARIVIASRSGIRSGILVDSVVDVVNVAADRLKRPMSTLDKTVREYAVGGETFYGDRYVTVLDVGKIFDRIAL